MKKIIKLIKNNYIVLLILSLSILIRFYGISTTPPSLSWDEAAVGYDAYSILQTGKDQWGQTMPIVFESFGEFKYPIHIYLTVLVTKFFGYSIFSVRAGSAILGVINVFLLYIITLKLTKNKTLAFISSLFLAFSPWHIQFSRVNWETNIGLSLFFLGLLFFLRSFEQKKWIIVSFIFFGLDLFSYNAAKIFIPLFVTVLVLINFKELLKNKLFFISGILIFFGFISLNFINPELSGIKRFSQISFNPEKIRSTYLYKLTKRQKIGAIELIGKNYLSHFTPEYLFISGDKNPRHSIQTLGEFYWFEMLLLPLGIYYLLKKNNKLAWLLLIWFILAPIPASIANEAPHASRSMFALGGWQIISASGFLFLMKLIKKKRFKHLFIGLSCVVYILSIENYLVKYFSTYSITYSDNWQYGYMKIFTDYKDDFNKYSQVIISDQFGQPYIFALYYLKYNPDKFRNEVIYNPLNDWGFSTVKSFDKFIFKKVDSSDLQKNSIVFATSSDKIENYDSNEIINFLDGETAFWVYRQ